MKPNQSLIDRVCKSITSYYEKSLNEHGVSLQGVDWKKTEDAVIRYELFLRAMTAYTYSSVLDAGCGLGFFLDYLLRTNKSGPVINYLGVDAVAGMIKNARLRHPGFSFSKSNIAN